MRTPSRRLLVWLSLCDCGQGLFFAGYLGGFLADQRVCLAPPAPRGPGILPLGRPPSPATTRAHVESLRTL